MKTISEQFKFRNVINLFLMMTFVLGMLTLAPADATASPMPQQDTTGELEIDPFDPSHPFTPEGVRDPFAVAGRLDQDGRPDDWASPEGDVMSPSAVPDPMMDDDPRLTWEGETAYSPRPEPRPGEGRVDQPLGSMIDPKRPQQGEPEAREFELSPDDDPLRETAPDATRGEIGLDAEDPYFLINLRWNEIYGRNWISESTITLTIDDPDVPGDVNYSDSVVAFDGGSVEFYLNNFTMEPGQVVTMSDGSTTKTHTIIDLAVTQIDEGANAIGGTADPGVLFIDVWDDFGGYENLQPEADGLGDWMVAFTTVSLANKPSADIYQPDSDGDVTRIYWRMPNPTIAVNPDWDEINGYDWSPNTDVTLTIGTSELTQKSYSDGSVYFYPTIDVQPGQELVMTDGTYTRTYTVSALAVTGFDEDAEIVSGIATPSREVEIYACDDSTCSWRYPVADEYGDWSADFFDSVDIAPGTDGWVYEYDDAGNSTRINWFIPNPYIRVYPDWDEINGYGWTSNTDVTLTIGAYELTQKSNSNGYVYFYPAIDVQPGQELVMTDGTYTRTHTVSVLAVMDIDEDLDIVYGIATPNRRVEINAYDNSNWAGRSPVADENGDWNANFSGSVDIAPGTYGMAYEYDDAGNSTRIRWFIPDPYISVYPDWDEIDGYDWKPNTDVTLTIGTYEVTRKSNSDGWVYFYPTIDVQPGQELVMTDGTYTRTYTVSALAVTGFDEDAEIVSGVATPNREVEIDAHDNSNWAERYPVANATGDWSADFSGSVNIAPGTDGWVYEYDDAGNSTRIRWFIPDPYIIVYPDWDEIDGYDWTPNTDVTLTIGTYELTQKSNSNGSVYFYPSFDIQPEQELVMTDGTFTRTHIVSTLAVTDFDEDAEIVYGIATPSREVEINACDDSTCSWRYPIADGNGDWYEDFSDSVDIAPGTDGWAYEYDDAGNSTRIHWNVPNPRMEVYPLYDEVEGYDFLPNAQITLTIGDDYWVRQSDAWGEVFFWLNPFDILPGHVVEMTDGTVTKTHTVRLEITEINEVTDTVMGKATPENEVEIYACDYYDCEWLNPVANEYGDWSANFSGSVDFVPGTDGWATEYDDDGDYTSIYWYLPDPHMSVYPERDNIYGYDWSPNTPVELYINNTWVATETASSWGSVYFYLDVDVVADQTVKLTDGTYTRTHTVTSLAVTDIDQDLNAVSGTAAAGSQVHIDGDNGYDWEDVITTVGSSGSWIANFTHLDIDPGSYGYARQYDDDGNSTNVYWHVPDPIIRVFPMDDYVTGEDWTPNTTITLTIGSYELTKVSDEDGWVRFYTQPFDIQPGQEVEMTDGTYTRTHTVTSLAVTGIDQDLNTVSGTAEAGSQVHIDGDNGYDWEDVITTVDASGNWTANFTYLEIDTGSYGCARQYDDDGNSTNVYWHVPDPFFQVYPLGDYIYGYDWTSNTIVTATIGGSSIGSGYSDSNGRVYFSSYSYDITFGDTVQLTDGTYTRTHTVKNIVVTNVNQTTETVSGTAQANTALSYVSARDNSGTWAYRYPVVNADGNWSANFSGDVDITAGVYGWAVQDDEEGNETCIRWYVPDPTMTIYPEDDRVYGYGWPPNTTITLNIGSGLWTGTGVSGYNGWVSFNTAPFDIKAGQTVTMSGGGYTKGHNVRSLAVTTVDEVNDTVSGTSAVSAQIVVWACNYYCNDLTVTANSSGLWTADFGGLVDIGPGASGSATQYDGDGDATRISWHVLDPFFIVRPNGDDVYGYDWTPNSSVTLTINDTLIATENSRYWGYVHFEDIDFDIQPGQTVVLSDGTYTKTHVVIDLAVTSYDSTANTLSGTANPGWLTIDAYDWSSWEVKYIEANESGEWTTTFSSVNIDIGTLAFIYQSDDDDDQTEIFWFIPDPRIVARPQDNTVIGTQWPAYTEITLTIDVDREIWTKTSSEYGDVYFDLEDFDLLPEHELVMTDAGGAYIQTHRVRYIKITSINLDDEIVTGLAEPGSEVMACVETFTGQYYTMVCLDVLADEIKGEWMANFSGSADITLDTYGFVQQSDEFDNYTVVYLEISTAAPVITGQVLLSTPEETPLLIELAHLHVTDADNTYPDDFTLTVMEGENYTLAGHTITPVLDFNGTLTVPVKVSDGTYFSNTFGLQVEVTPVNDPPVITESDPVSVTMSEDGDPTLFSLTLNATDVDGDTLTWSIATSASHGTAVASGTGYSKAIGYIPDKDYYGSDSFVVQVDDGNGGIDTITVNVTIESVNDPPVVGNIPNQSINQGESFTTISLDDYVEDVDHPKDAIAWTTSGETDLTVTIDASRIATITIPVDWSGSETITFIATDPEGLSDSDYATFSVNAAGNNPPVFEQSDPVEETMSEDGDPAPFDLTLIAIDDDGDTLTWSISTPASHGTASASGDGTSKAIGYIPNADYNGSDSFVVQVIDGKGGSATITVNVTIQPVNDPPVITGQAHPLTTPEETALIVTLTDLMVTDVDEDDIYPDDFTLIVLAGDHYSVDGNTITPDVGFIGDLLVNVKVNDGEADSNVYQLSVTVTEKVTEGFQIFLPLIVY